MYGLCSSRQLMFLNEMPGSFSSHNLNLSKCCQQMSKLHNFDGGYAATGAKDDFWPLKALATCTCAGADTL